MTLASDTETALRLPGTNINPKKSTPASAAVRAASDDLIPQILTNVVPCIFCCDTGRISGDRGGT